MLFLQRGSTSMCFCFCVLSMPTTVEAAGSETGLEMGFASEAGPRKIAGWCQVIFGKRLCQ